MNDGIWDDGEWISWDEINHHLYKQELKEQYPEVSPEIVMVFEDLVIAASEYKSITGRYLQIWGELGELYAVIKYGIHRHKPHTQGSDGRLGDDFVEIKTISPEKESEHVFVKRSGNFSKLLLVKISAEFEFESMLIDRKDMNKGEGKHARVKWSPKDE